MEKRRRQDRGPGRDRVGTFARWLLPSIGSLCILLIVYLLVFNSWRFLLDSDTGWHIRAGELILQTGSAPRTDPFSHSMSGREWFAWEWLSDVVIALAHDSRGLGGVVGGSILVLLLAYTALYQLMIWRGSDPIIALAMTVFAAVCSIVHWLARPHLLSIAMLIIWYAMVESFRRRRARWICFVPLLIALWANLHGAFVVTFVVLAVYAAGEWLESGIRGDWRSKKVRRVLLLYLIAGALSAFAALMTPYGFKLYGHLWRYLTDKQLLAAIQEFQSPNFHSTDGKLIEILLLLGVIAAVNALRQRRLVESGLLLLWGHMTLQSERHVTLAAVTLCPIIAEQLTLLAKEMTDRLARSSGTRARAMGAVVEWYRATMNINRRLTGAFVYATVLIFVIFLPVSRWADKLLSPHFSPKRFPVAAADFILESGLTGNMFSHDQFGGYLIYRLYPKFKVFVDGRSDFYRQGAVLEEMDQLVLVRPRWSEILDKRGIQFMVLRRGEALASVALMSGQWTNVHDDPFAQVLVRKSSPRDRAVNSKSVD